ncbi:MAG: hypothetical protein RLZZ184_3433 [Cyanobacteriota bacterium]
MKEYVLISQDQVKVEVYRQDEKRNWTIQTLINRDDKLHLDSVGLILEMTDIYEDVINVAIM